MKLQLLPLLELEEVNVVAAPTNYGRVTILNLGESPISTLSNIRHIEALLIDDVAAAELQQPSTASNAPHLTN